MTTRTRTIQWEDPAITEEAARRLGGLGMMRALLEGRLPTPPSALLVGFRLVEAAEGLAVFELAPGEHQYNPTGGVHGGLLSTVLDSALGCAVLSTIPPGVGYTTVELHVNFVRAVTKDTPPLRATARLLHKGRTMRTAEAKLEDAQGRLYAHATTTCLVLRPEP